MAPVVRALGENPAASALEVLRIGSKAGDDALEAFVEGEWRALRHLDLGDNRIGDAGLEHLAAWAGLARLEVLDINRNRTSDTGRRRLRKSPHWPAGLASVFHRPGPDWWVD